MYMTLFFFYFNDFFIQDTSEIGTTWCRFTDNILNSSPTPSWFFDNFLDSGAIPLLGNWGSR